MNCKVEKTDNANEVKLEITVEASKFEDAMKKVYFQNAKYDEPKRKLLSLASTYNVFGILYAEGRLYLFKGVGKQYLRLSDEFNIESKGKIPRINIDVTILNALLAFTYIILFH